MSHTKFADLNTANINDDYSYKVMSVGDRVVMLGIWEFGLASAANTYSLEGLEQFSAPEGCSDRFRRDVEKANSLLACHPRWMFDAFSGARDIIIFLYREESRLTGKGYNGEAKFSAIEGVVNKAFAELNKLTDVVLTAQKRGDEIAAFIRSDFPVTGESEFQEVIFDAAIIARTAPINDTEKASLKAGSLIPRFNDTRLIQALYRTPAAMHGIDADTMLALQDCYAAVAWPCATQAVVMVSEMISSARVALASAVMTASYVGNLTPDVAFAKVKGGDWLREVRHQTLAISKDDMKRTERLERLAVGDYTHEV